MGLTRSPNQDPSLPNPPARNPSHEAEIPDPIPLIFEKNLTPTDVAGNRLLIGDEGEQRLMRALTRAERGRLRTNYLRVVTTMDEGGSDNAEYKLRLKKYNSGAMFLQKQWRNLVIRNGLRHGDSVTGYGYHNHDGQFRLSISVIRRNG
ncbi:hypothetical protein AAHA92_07593 [Salvia divinorum]|uniref:TF-B3 domain-containing protein n=1 Tax=Salvia divinorum TaxID=28513 RepID=A0ABD1IAI9_SALDI